MTCRVNARPLRGPLLTKTRQHDTLRSVFAFRHCSAANSQSMCQAMRSPLPANMRTYGDILPLQLTHVLHKPSSRACSLFSSTSFLPILHASTPTVTTTHFAKHPPTMKRPPPYQFIKVFGVLPQKQHNCGSVCKSERYASAGEPSRGRLTQRLSWLAREVWYCSASGSSQGGLTGQRFGQFAERLVNHRAFGRHAWHIGAIAPLYARQPQHIINYFPYTSA